MRNGEKSFHLRGCSGTLLREVRKETQNTSGEEMGIEREEFHKPWTGRSVTCCKELGDAASQIRMFRFLYFKSRIYRI